jgi:uncharacterized peroxidase-related enzyme
MTREAERLERASEEPIVGGLPDVPGIGVAMRLKPELGTHLRALADQLLVVDYPGATISRFEREMLATATSAANDCFFCMDSHGEHALALLDGDSEAFAQAQPLVDVVKSGASEGFSPKMQALLAISRTVRGDARQLSLADVQAALSAGATDADVQLAILIASGFSMYNRLVEGFRARTPPSVEMYRGRAGEIAQNGYSGAIPSASGTSPKT